VAVARAAEYGLEATKPMAAALVARHFEQMQRAGAVRQRVAPATRELVEAIALNLMNPWPMRGEFDVIFYRNVMIYFDQATRERLVERFVERFVKRLRPGGYLMIGHSENLSSSRQILRYVQPAVYQV
jgi:chemotaxis protein methyltransferase CheR